MTSTEILEELKKLEHEAEQNCEYPEMNICLLELQDCIEGIKTRLKASGIDYPEFGQVLWWSEKDQNGVIVDQAGNEFYVDKSVVKGGNALRRNQNVSFIAGRLNDGTPVARRV